MADSPRTAALYAAALLFRSKPPQLEPRLELPQLLGEGSEPTTLLQSQADQGDKVARGGVVLGARGAERPLNTHYPLRLALSSGHSLALALLTTTLSESPTMELSTALQNGLDDGRPSLFGSYCALPVAPPLRTDPPAPELLAEQQLSALVPPSLRYLLVLATHRRPRYLLRVLNAFDELYALLALVVERHYLRTHGGGFVEHFYGLKRERALRMAGGAAPRAQLLAPERMREVTALTNADVWRNLLVMVGVPYLKRKLDEAHAIHVPSAAVVGRFHTDTLPPNATFRQRVFYYYKWFLRRVYPSVNAAYYFALLAFNLAYLFSNTAYSSPFLWLVRTKVRRLGVADYRVIALASEKAAAVPPRRQGSSALHPRNLAASTVPRLLSGLKLALPASIFALKFLEWWHASDFARQLSRQAAEGLELPPPTVAGLPEREQTEGQQSHEAGPDQTAPGSSEKRLVKSALKARKPKPPVAAGSRLPILTVPAPTAATSALCPICLKGMVNPTAAQTGFVFCYTCIFRWVDGSHERQAEWMRGGSGGEGWGDDEGYESDGKEKEGSQEERRPVSREGKWENGKGRCAITGRRLLGSTGGLRRVII